MFCCCFLFFKNTNAIKSVKSKVHKLNRESVFFTFWGKKVPIPGLVQALRSNYATDVFYAIDVSYCDIQNKLTQKSQKSHLFYLHLCFRYYADVFLPPAIRSMTKVMFSLCLSTGGKGGGQGTPPPPRKFGPWGYPAPPRPPPPENLDLEGTPPPTRKFGPGGYLAPPPPENLDLEGTPPPQKKIWTWRIRTGRGRGQYASCGHAGGLSCVNCAWFMSKLETSIPFLTNNYHSQVQ